MVVSPQLLAAGMADSIGTPTRGATPQLLGGGMDSERIAVPQLLTARVGQQGMQLEVGPPGVAYSFDTVQVVGVSRSEGLTPDSWSWRVASVVPPLPAGQTIELRGSGNRVEYVAPATKAGCTITIEATGHAAGLPDSTATVEQRITAHSWEWTGPNLDRPVRGPMLAGSYDYASPPPYVDPVIDAPQDPAAPIRFGTLITDPRHITGEVAAGVDYLELPFEWRYWFPTADGAGNGVRNANPTTNYIAGRMAVLDQMIAAGARPVINFGLHRPPTWIAATYGADVLYTSSTGQLSNAATLRPSNPSAGFDVLDLTLSAKARQLAEAYMRDVVAVIGAERWAKCTTVRGGTNNNDEQLYPQIEGSVYSWWSGSARAQAGVGLAAGMTAAPNTGTPTGAQVGPYLQWYSVDCRAKTAAWFTDFICGTLGFPGTVAVIAPGRGVKAGDWTAALAATTLPNLTNGAARVAAVGAVWHKVFEQINASPWAGRTLMHSSSVADGSGSNTPPQPADLTLELDDPAADTFGAARYFRLMSSKFTRLAGLSGENPGAGSSGYGATMMTAVFAILAAGGWRYFQWAHDKDLWSDDDTPALVPVQTYYDKVAAFRAPPPDPTPAPTVVTLAGYDFTGQAAATGVTPAATTVNAGVTASPLTAGGGLAPLEVFTAGGYTSSPVLRVASPATSTPGNTVGNGAYFTFTVTPVGGGPVTLKALSFKAARGGSSTVRGFLVRSSLDSFAADLIPATDIVTVRPDLTAYTVDLGTYPAVTEATTFRIHIYNNANGATVEFDDIVLTGVVSGVVVPPPVDPELPAGYDPDDPTKIALPAGWTRIYAEGFDQPLAVGEITYTGQGVLTGTAATKYGASWRTYGNVDSTHGTKVYPKTVGEDGYQPPNADGTPSVFWPPISAKWRADKTVSVANGYLIIHQHSDVTTYPGVLTNFGAAIVPILGDGSDSEYMIDPYLLVEFSIQSFEVMRDGVDLALARDVTSGRPLGMIRVPLLIASDWWTDGSETDFPDGEHNRPTAGTYIDAFTSLRNHKVYPPNSMPYDKQVWRYTWTPGLMLIHMNGALVYTATGSNVPSDPQAFVMQLEANWRQAAITSSAKSRIGYILVAKMSTPPLFAADVFAGALTTTTPGTSSGPGNPVWQNLLTGGSWGRDGNGKLYPFAGPALVALDCKVRGHAVEFTVDGLPSVTTTYAGPATRIVDVNNYYWCDFNSAGAGRLYKMIEGVATQIGTLAAASVAVGDIVKMKHQGFWITVYRNGVKILVVKTRETRSTYEAEVLANRKARNGTMIGFRVSSSTGIASVRFSNLKVTSA